MTDIGELKKDIDLLKKTIIYQLKNSDWEETYYGFKNEYFDFKKKTKEPLKVTVGDWDELEVYDIIGKWHFKWLKFWYVRSAIKNHENVKKMESISNASKRFFRKNESLARDTKLNNLLD